MAYGSTIGSALGAIGGGLAPIPGGAIAGGALGSLIGGQFDRSSKTNPNRMGGIKGLQQVQNLTPQQQSILNQLGSSGLQTLQNPYAGFEGIEQYSQDQFRKNIVPSIAERFTSLGGAGAQRSSAFPAALGAAGADLASQLGMMRAQYGMQNRTQGLDALRLGLTPSFENVRLPHEPGSLENILSSLVASAGDKLPEILQILQQYLSQGGVK